MPHDAQSDLESTPTPDRPTAPPDDSESASTQGLGLLEEDIAPHAQTGVQWIVGAGVVLAIALGGTFAYYQWFRAEPTPVSVGLVPVQRGDVRIRVTETGTVELGGQQTLTAPEDVTVEAIPVDERQRVSRGDILLELRARQVQRDLGNALVETQIVQNDVMRDREIIQERQARLDRAQERFREAQELLDQGFISQDDYLRDQDQVEDAQSNLRDAQVELANSELRLRNLQLQIQSLRTQLADTQITAPFDAMILRIHVNQGDGVQQGGDLLTVGDPNQELVRLQLSDINAQKVRVNLSAQVSLLGPDPQTFAARVVRIAPQAQASGNSQEEQATVEAEVRLDAPSNVLIPGSLVSVDIIVEERRDVLQVPTTALQSEAGAFFVWVRDRNNMAQKRPVTIGLQSVETVEITSGLEAGDEVITTPPPDQPLRPGMPLAVPEAIDDP